MGGDIVIPAKAGIYKAVDMFNLLRTFLYPEPYIWVDVLLLKETQKAILIEFDDKTAWLPKALILRMKHNNDSDIVRIKISQYHWEKKFW